GVPARPARGARRSLGGATACEHPKGGEVHRKDGPSHCTPHTPPPFGRNEAASKFDGSRRREGTPDWHRSNQNGWGLSTGEPAVGRRYITQVSTPVAVQSPAALHSQAPHAALHFP